MSGQRSRSTSATADASSDLWRGGALSAVGLYVGQRVISTTYYASQRLLRYLSPMFDSEYMDPRPFLTWISTDSSPPMVTRDVTVGGGGLLLHGQGLFYIEAPDYMVHELCYGESSSSVDDIAHTRVCLTAHMHLLYLMAQSWNARSNATTTHSVMNGHMFDALLQRRYQAFACDCLLHMLLNDFVRIPSGTYTEEDKRLCLLLTTAMRGNGTAAATTTTTTGNASGWGARLAISSASLLSAISAPAKSSLDIMQLRRRAKQTYTPSSCAMDALLAWVRTATVIEIRRFINTRLSSLSDNSNGFYIGGNALPLDQRVFSLLLPPELQPHFEVFVRQLQVVDESDCGGLKGHTRRCGRMAWALKPAP